MELNRVNARYEGFVDKTSSTRPAVEDDASTLRLISDWVDLQGKRDAGLIDLKKVPFLPMSAQVRGSKPGSDFRIKVIELPTPTTTGARNDTPVVIVHGTLADKESVEELHHYFQGAGHGTDLATYMSIKEGQHLEVSGQSLSQHINEDRLQMLELHLGQLDSIKNDPAALMTRLGMGADLYDKHDASVEKIAGLIPGLIGSLEDLVALGKPELLETFGRRSQKIEQEFAAAVGKTGFASDVRDPKLRQELCGKVAAEVMDSLAPKAVMVGHSMGGFVSYAVAMNPKTDMNDKSPFSYDAASGISTVVVLSSPIKSGVNRPLPPALTNRYDDLLQRYFLNAMENTPGMQLAMTNPFFAAWYNASRSASREMSGAMSDMGTAILSPIIYAQKPGVDQISEGSDFIHKYVENKKIPYGMTVVAMTCDQDGVSVADRSTVDDTQPNGQNVKAQITVKPEDMASDPSRTPSIAAHRMMATHPFKHVEEYRQQIQENPREIPRALDKSNYDGGRWKCLQALLADVKDNPRYFDKPDMRPALASIKQVADEKLPFNDSPSYVARQILDVIEGPRRSPKGTHAG